MPLLLEARFSKRCFLFRQIPLAVRPLPRCNRRGLEIVSNRHRPQAIWTDTDMINDAVSKSVRALGSVGQGIRLAFKSLVVSLRVFV